VTIWAVQTELRELRTVKAHEVAVWDVAVHPDGRSFASASNDSTIRLCNLPASNESLRQFQTIKKFFGLVASLTDRKDIDFLRVTDNFRVMVGVAEAPDGVPSDLGTLAALAALLARFRAPEQPELPPFHGGIVGWIGYDTVREIERLPAVPHDDLGFGELMCNHLVVR
jgi:anthranilate/para-aminobenzoate synthase component I